MFSLNVRVNAIKPKSWQVWSWQAGLDIAQKSGKYSPVDIYQCKNTMQSFLLTNQSKCNYLFVISHYVCCIQCKCSFTWGSRVFNVKSIILISSHWWMFSSWYECIFLFLSHIFQILDIVLCPSNTIAFQEKKTPFPWIYFPGPRALFHHCFNPSLFKSLIRQSIFPMLFDNHVSLLMAYPINYSSCCENCTCIY